MHKFGLFFESKNNAFELLFLDNFFQNKFFWIFFFPKQILLDIFSKTNFFFDMFSKTDFLDIFSKTDSFGYLYNFIPKQVLLEIYSFFFSKKKEKEKSKLFKLISLTSVSS